MVPETRDRIFLAGLLVVSLVIVVLGYGVLTRWFGVYGVERSPATGVEAAETER